MLWRHSFGLQALVTAISRHDITRAQRLSALGRKRCVRRIPGRAPVTACGLFGKLPARGDFVRHGLPASFVTPWDDWLSAGLAASRAQLGADWLPAWLEAPVWRFCLDPGRCGPAAVLGLMLPSVDRVGRYFPLTLAAVLTHAEADAAATAWLDAAEAAGRAALEQDAGPEQVAALLPAAPVGTPAHTPIHTSPGSLWWTEGGPRVAAARRRLPGLPDAADFAALLRDPLDATLPAAPAA